MSAPVIAPGTSSADLSLGVGCRVRQRHQCGLQTSCRPIAARSEKDLQWPAQIRDISVASLSLVLGRRFEPGAGLAIEIPATASTSGDTLLVRVLRVTAEPDGTWLLGCAFVSELSEEELQGLLHLARAQQPQEAEPDDSVRLDELWSPPGEDEPPSMVMRTGKNKSFLISSLNFEGTREKARAATVPIRRLFLSGDWPPPAGTVLKIRVAQLPAHPGIRVRVNRCYLRNGRWTVNYTLLDEPTTEMMRLFGYLKSLV
jgi:hypothetical protein